MTHIYSALRELWMQKEGGEFGRQTVETLLNPHELYFYTSLRCLCHIAYLHLKSAVSLMRFLVVWGKGLCCERVRHTQQHFVLVFLTSKDAPHAAELVRFT